MVVEGDCSEGEAGDRQGLEGVNMNELVSS